MSLKPPFGIDQFVDTRNFGDVNRLQLPVKQLHAAYLGELVSTIDKKSGSVIIGPLRSVKLYLDEPEDGGEASMIAKLKVGRSAIELSGDETIIILNRGTGDPLTLL